MADLKEAAPEMVSAFFGFDKAVFKKDTGTRSALFGTKSHSTLST